MFGLGRRRRAAAAEAAREADRRALFAQLAQRPENICPFLGLAYERTGYVEGPSIEHRCFAFGDPAPLSSEQQTRVCQERGYGQCPRYLRGLLVTPPDELQALRGARAAEEPLPARPEPAVVATAPMRRRGGMMLVLLTLVLVVVGGAAAYLLLGAGGFVGLGSDPSGTATPTTRPQPTGQSEAATATAEPTQQPGTATPTPSTPAQPTPSPEPTPAAGDTFAFYEVSVGPGQYPLYELDASGQVVGQRTATFDAYSFARVEPIEGADGEVYWQTVEGGLAGLSYRYPDSGDFGIRAVFLDDSGERRSVVLAEDELDEFPEATPAP